MKKALIENGIVTNLIVVDPTNIPDWCADWPDAPDTARIGGQYTGGVFVSALQEPDAEDLLDEERNNMRLSFPQLLIGLVSEAWITVEEGRAWRAQTALPAPVLALIASLPEEYQFAAETRAFAPSEVLRMDPMVIDLGALKSKSLEELDQFFRIYSQV